MANAWKKYKSNKLTTPKLLFLLTSTSLILLTFFYLSTPTTPPTTFFNPTSPIHPFNCTNTPQPHPIIANQVEGLKHPFIYSLSDFGSLPDKPHKNIVRMLKGKLFRRPDISVTVQDLLDKMRAEGRTGAFVDVGANVGMATFAAAVMGFRVYAFEPVLENLQSVCNGIYFNRVGDLVRLFEAATSDRLGNITFHKLVGRLDNSAVSAAGAKLAFKSNEEVELQGWEYHVLKGAKKLLSRKKGEAPYLIYEEDERLLQASNSSSTEIRKFLGGLGYTHCVQKGTDAHCTK
ncbi:putative methyltransferase FkbM, S-adenosyl-L-methionine-dependent methyltransferase [Helianthus annuus]|nr:putative methyltransferase FkbM, S-adenosyl-L-methionine-dependent methyltransferase [Helianthus annuus]